MFELLTLQENMNGSDNGYQSNAILSDDETVLPGSLHNHTLVDHPNQTFRIISDAPTTQSIHTILSHDDGNLFVNHCALIIILNLNRKYLYLTSFPSYNMFVLNRSRSKCPP